MEKQTLFDSNNSTNSNNIGSSNNNSNNDNTHRDSISIDDEYLKSLVESLNDPILQLPATQVFNDILYCISIIPQRTCRYHMRTYKDCFTGEECVLGIYTFLKAKNHGKSHIQLKLDQRDQIVVLCQRIYTMGYIRSAVNTNKNTFHADTHPYRYISCIKEPADSSSLSNLSRCNTTANTLLISDNSDASVSSSTNNNSIEDKLKKGFRHHPYLKHAAATIKRKLYRNKSLIYTNNNNSDNKNSDAVEWVDVIISRILVYVDLQYLDKILNCEELSNDVIIKNIEYYSKAEEGYIPEWLETILEWLASYTDGSQLPKFDTNSDFKLDKIVHDPDESVLIKVFALLCKHLEEHYAPLIHSSYFELFKELDNKFEIYSDQRSHSNGLHTALQLFLLLLTPFVRNYIRFIFSYLVRISENPYFTKNEDSQNANLNFLLLNIKPILIRLSARQNRRTSKTESVSTGLFHHLARNPVTSFEIPEEILNLYKLDFSSISFTEFVSTPRQAKYVAHSNSDVTNISDTEFLRSTQTKSELEQLLQNVLKEKSIDSNKRFEFIHTFSVTYPEIYKKSIREMP